MKVGAPEFTPEDRVFAEAIRREIGVTGRSEEPLAVKVAPFSTEIGNGSTDVGDVSWVVPTAGFGVATAARDVPGHSWAMTACAGSTIGAHGSVTAMKVLAISTLDLLLDEKLRSAAQDDFKKRVGETVYEPVLDTGPPPARLDDF
jgi:aminobenzoyl-glutamate utilization protein B